MSCASRFRFASRLPSDSWSRWRGATMGRLPRSVTRRAATKAEAGKATGGPAQTGKNTAKTADSTKDAGKTAKNAAPAAGKPVSFIRDVAPILVENCIACHNPRKSESKYVMTTFTQLAKGGQQGEGITLEPGKPDESNLVEVIRPDGKPRMPYKQDPLPPEKIATIERWVAEGAKYDGSSPAEDWTILLAEESASHDSGRLSRDGADHGARIQPGRHDDRGVRLS